MNVRISGAGIISPLSLRRGANRMPRELAGNRETPRRPRSTSKHRFMAKHGPSRPREALSQFHREPTRFALEPAPRALLNDSHRLALARPMRTSRWLAGALRASPSARSGEYRTAEEESR